MQAIIHFIKQALSEKNGKPSSLRLNSTWTSVLFTLVLAFGFVYTVFAYPQYLIEFAIILSGLIAGVLGIKSNQKGKESDVQ